MMMNLFSMFDPSLLKFNMAWFPCLIPMILMANMFKLKNSFKFYTFKKSMGQFLSKELSSLLYPNQKNFSKDILIKLFFTCLIMNSIALTPFTFTPTAHLSIAFTISLIMWFSFMLFGWMKNFKNMMAHMVPSGTPNQLMNFMVLIEMVSNLIRPITLSVRLSANMVAGHLLMSLLGSFCLSSKIAMFNLPLMLMLASLEVGVSLIQAYVLMTLITLYSVEVH